MKTIAIIGAMQEEITPLLARFESSGYERLKIGGNLYYKTALHGYNIVVAYSKIGKIHAALTCATMILHFGADYVIFTGVAGSLDSRLKIGDIVLAKALCQHDVDISAFGHALGFIPESNLYIRTNDALNDIARKVAKSKQIALNEGNIASGDVFVSSAEKKAWIIEHFDVCAAEMEGASIAVVSDLLDVPFCVIRSISDNADDSADVSFDEFLVSSAEISADFVLAMIDEMAQNGL